MIGIGDVPDRISAKAILFSVGDDAVSATDPLQVHAGHVARSEVAVLATWDMLHTAGCEGAVLVDTIPMFLILSTIKLPFIIPHYSALLCQLCCILPTVLLSDFLLIMREEFHLLRVLPREILLL